MKLLSKDEEIPVQQIANILGIKREKAKDLLKQAGKKANISFRFKKSNIKVNNQEKFIQNISEFSGFLIEMLIMDSYQDF